MALTELARFLPRSHHHNRYLRSGLRPHHRIEDEGTFDAQGEPPTDSLD
jgi:putative (di)nucleoside polyphosphate hydrolase